MLPGLIFEKLIERGETKLYVYLYSMALTFPLIRLREEQKSEKTSVLKES